MAYKPLDSRQILYRQTLQQLFPYVSGETLDVLLASINSEVTPPLSVTASNPASLVINVGGTLVVNPESNRQKSVTFINNVIPSLSSGTVTFPSSSGGNITTSTGGSTPLTLPSGDFCYVLLTLDDLGDIGTIVGTPASSAPSAVVPSPSGSVLPFAYVLLSNVSGTIQNVAQNNIYQLAGGSGGSSSSASASYDVQNVGLSASVTSNALTINLTQADGASSPSGGSPVFISFRDPTSTTGGYNKVTVSSALSITVPSGATLGQTSGMNQYVWVYVLDDGGTVDLCVSGIEYFNQGANQSTTQISSGATDGYTLYSASTHSGSLPIRLLGRILINEATAGTWASGPSDIQINPTVTYSENDWTYYTPTLSAVGTATAVTFQYKRHGDSMDIRGYFTSGTPTGTPIEIGLPSGLTINFNNQLVGESVIYGAVHYAVNTGFYPSGGSGPWPTFSDNSTNVIFFGAAAGNPNVSARLTKQNGTDVLGSGYGVYLYAYDIPIAGWSSNGP